MLSIPLSVIPAALLLYVESHPKSIEEIEYMWVLFVAKRIFTPSILMPPRGSIPPKKRSSSPAEDFVLGTQCYWSTKWHWDSGFDRRGSVYLQSKQRSQFVNSGFKQARRKQCPHKIITHRITHFTCCERKHIIFLRNFLHSLQF